MFWVCQWCCFQSLYVKLNIREENTQNYHYFDQRGHSWLSVWCLTRRHWSARSPSFDVEFCWLPPLLVLLQAELWVNDALLTETLSCLYMNEMCDEKISNAIYIKLSLFLVSFSERYCTSINLVCYIIIMWTIDFILEIFSLA